MSWNESVLQHWSRFEHSYISRTIRYEDRVTQRKAPEQESWPSRLFVKCSFSKVKKEQFSWNYMNMFLTSNLFQKKNVCPLSVRSSVMLFEPQNPFRYWHVALPSGRYSPHHPFTSIKAQKNYKSKLVSSFSATSSWLTGHSHLRSTLTVQMCPGGQ